jgi:hypothetical protein
MALLPGHESGVNEVKSLKNMMDQLDMCISNLIAFCTPYRTPSREMLVLDGKIIHHSIRSSMGVYCKIFAILAIIKVICVSLIRWHKVECNTIFISSVNSLMMVKFWRWQLFQEMSVLKGSPFRSKSPIELSQIGVSLVWVFSCDPRIFTIIGIWD